MIRKITGLALISVFAACGGEKSPPPDPSALSAPFVKTITVTQEKLTPEIESFGSISYRSKADISTTVDGTVKKLNADEGDRVRIGQPLAVLENIQITIRKSQAESGLRSAQAAVELAKSQLWEGKKQVEARILALKKTRLDIEQKKREVDDLKTTLDNREQLFKVDGISEEQLQSLRLQYQSASTSYQGMLLEYEVNSIGLRDQDIKEAGIAVPSREDDRVSVLIRINTQTLQAQLDAAEASHQSAKSDLEAANALVEELSIDSPVNGVIGVRQCGVGERLRAGDKLFTIIDYAEVYAVFPIPESKSMSLAEGMPVRIEVPALGNRIYGSKISIISPVLDPQSGNLTIRSLVSNVGGALKPGLFIRVRVQTAETRKTILLPTSALVGRSGLEASVYVVKSGRCFRNKVTLRGETESQMQGKIEVANGVSPGDTVIDEPSPVLQDGGEVRVQN